MGVDPADPPASSLADRRLARERQARLQAEAIAEQGFRELFERQQEIQLLGAIAEAANSATSVEEAMRSALSTICAFTKWPVGHYCAIVTDTVEEKRYAVATDIWYLPPSVRGIPDTSESIARLATALDLPARILATGGPIWIQDTQADGGRAGATGLGPADEVAGTRAAFALPVLAGEEVAAVLEFFAPAIVPNPHLLQLLVHVGVQLGRVIERERARKQTIDAFHDPLTFLPNRALFLRFVQRAMNRQQRSAANQFAVLFIDLDGFKVVNDSLGHRAGDALLLQVGSRLAQCSRATDTIGRLTAASGSGEVQDTVARLGGDEFTILLEDIHDVSDAIRVAERIHAAVARSFRLGPAQEVFASASIGIAVGGPGHRSAEDVLQDADIAMYRAKGQGKGRTEVFGKQMYRQAVARLKLETDVRHAVTRGELVLAYQPLVHLQTRAISGFEALVRWRHPTRGILEPSEFIPIAESGGAIVDIGEWVLGEACRQLRAWQQQYALPALTMAVNLSAKQLGFADLVEQVARALYATGVAPDRLCLELTETIAMERAAQSEQRFVDLRELGVQLAIDDFGTGYSSLSYLTRFRVNGLKLDRVFIRQLSDMHGEMLVRAVLSLGHNLGLSVVAEGVETADEAERLTSLGCLFAQGFHFGKPLWREAAERILADGSAATRHST